MLKLLFPLKVKLFPLLGENSQKDIKIKEEKMFFLLKEFWQNSHENFVELWLNFHKKIFCCFFHKERFIKNYFFPNKNVKTKYE